MGIKTRSRDRKHETNPFDWRGVVSKMLFCKERHMSVTNENFHYCANETMPLNTLRLPKFNFLIFYLLYSYQLNTEYRPQSLLSTSNRKRS